MVTIVIVVLVLLVVGAIAFFATRRPEAISPSVEPSTAKPKKDADKAPEKAVEKEQKKEEPKAEAKKAERAEAAEARKSKPAPAPEPAKTAEPKQEAPSKLEPVVAKAEATAAPTPAGEPVADGKKESVAALKKGLAETRGGFIARLAALFGRKKEIDPALLDEIQAVLITADIGPHTTEKMLGRLRERLDRRELGSEDAV